MIYSRTNTSMIYVATKKKMKTYMDESYSIIDEVEILIPSVISPKSKAAVKKSISSYLDYFQKGILIMSMLIVHFLIKVSYA